MLSHGLICLLLAVVPQQVKFTPVKLVRVLDGDTVIIQQENGERLTARLEGIDAPEWPQKHGKKAADELKRMLSRKTLSVRLKSVDKYKRQLVDLTASGKNVNMAMVHDGWAYHYTEKNKDPALKTAEKSAKDAKRGIWKDSDRVTPWAFREEAKRVGDPMVHYTNYGEKYHRKNCRYLKKSDHEIALSSAYCYGPKGACRVCKPPVLPGYTIEKATGN